MDPKKTALVLIEFQNDFTTERGTLQALVEWAKTDPKGEMVIVIAGAVAKEVSIE